MIRHLLITLAVLVPFAGLVAFGFSLLTDPPAYVPPPVVVRIEAPPAAVPIRPPPPVRPMPPPLPIAVPVIAPPPIPPPVPEVKHPPEDLSPDAKRLPMLASVEPLVQQCFKDVSDRMHEPLRVTVAFDPSTGGRFDNVVIKKITWQDPNLTACILDSFTDAHFEPNELKLKRQSYTFTFGAPDAGR